MTCGKSTSCLETLLQLLGIGLSNGAVIALNAVAVTLVYGAVRTINFAHGDLFALASVLVITLVKQLGLLPGAGALALAGGLALTLAAAAGFGSMLNLAVERAAFRPFRGGARLAPLIASVAISLILYQAALLWRRTEPSFIPGEHRSVPGLPELPRGRIPDLIPRINLLRAAGLDLRVSYTIKDLLVLALALLCTLALEWFLRRSATGRSLRAAAQDPELLRLCGVDHNRVIRIAFALSGALAGTAAFIFAVYYEHSFGLHGIQSGLIAFAAAILGGIGRPLGACAGGLLLGVLAAFSDYFLQAQWTPALILAALIVVLLLRPSGLAREEASEDLSPSPLDVLVGQERPRSKLWPLPWLRGLLAGRLLPASAPLGADARPSAGGAAGHGALGASRPMLPPARRSGAPPLEDVPASGQARLPMAGLWLRRWALPGLALAIGLAYPLLDQALGLRQQTVATAMLIFMLVTLGLNLLLGYAGMLDLGFAACFGVGGYTAALLTVPGGRISSLLPGRPDFVLVLLLGATAATLFGALSALLTLRLRGDYLAIVTLAFGQLVPLAMVNLDDWTGGSAGISAIPPPRLLGLTLLSPQSRFYLALGAVALAALASWRLARSRLGRAWRAMSQDAVAAASCGVDASRQRLLVFMLGAAMAGLAGALYAASFGYIDPEQSDVRISVMALAMVVVGGLGSVRGALLGTLLLMSYDQIVIPQLGAWIERRAEPGGLLDALDVRDLSYLSFGLVLYLTVLLRGRARRVT